MATDDGVGIALSRLPIALVGSAIPQEAIHTQKSPALLVVVADRFRSSEHLRSEVRSIA